ncbi:MAG: adenylate/guanylate cyclase domain-containing protein [Desulfatiglandales bacterium]
MNIKRYISLFTINPLSLTVYLTFLIILLFLIGPPFLEIVELKTLDLRFKSRGIRKGSDAVVLAVIDEKSLDKEGRWPWPRSKIAGLIDYLSDDGAKVIAFDIGFLEPDENNNLSFIQQLEAKVASLKLKSKELDSFLDKSKVLANNDLILANAIKRSKAKVILGYFFHMSQKALGYKIERETIDNNIAQISGSRYSIIQFYQEEPNIDSYFESYSPEVNLSILNQSADSSGHFNMFPDIDGTVRWIPLIIKCGQDIFPALAIRSIWHYLDQPPLIVKIASYGVEGVQMGQINIPTDESGQMMINYLGPPKVFPHYSIADIINNKIPKGEFKDKIVIAGATAIGIYDLRSTPFSTIYPGLEIHATVIDNILQKQFLFRPKWTKIFDLLAIILIGIIMGFVIPRLSAVKGILFAIGLFMAYIFFSRLLFVKYGLWFNITYPLAALIVIYISLTIYKYMSEERERKKIKGAFTYYVSSSVVNEMLKHPEKLKLGGDRKDLSVLFSDIRGFTTIAEGLTPEDLVHLLNEYLTVMTDIVFKYDGTLDKYMGDAIMAIYGAPLDLPDHPLKACQSALEMIKELKRLNQKWIGEGKQPMDIGIGINTSPMMVGNMGSVQRFDFTVMGDSVNLGSRLEGANKSYKTNIIISEFTFERVKNELACMELDSVRVKGKKQPVRIYNLIGDKDLPDIQETVINQFNQAVSLYKERKWDEAIHIFENITVMDPNLYAAEAYIERCLDLKKKPPSADWDGVYEMTTK